jgi:hypothetical protein
MVLKVLCIFQLDRVFHMGQDCIKMHWKSILQIGLITYNYIRFQRSLRIKINNRTEKFTKKYQSYTPAMKIGLTQSVLT